MSSCSTSRTSKTRPKRSFPDAGGFRCSKGGPFRKWFGNNEFVLNWHNDGEEIRNFTDDQGRLKSRPQNLTYLFRQGIPWSTISSSDSSFRFSPHGRAFESTGSTCFPRQQDDMFYLLGLLNSSVIVSVLRAISPTLNYGEGMVGTLPVATMSQEAKQTVASNSEAAVALAMSDWNSTEKSWDFERSPLLAAGIRCGSVSDSASKWKASVSDRIERMRELEEANNAVCLSAYRTGIRRRWSRPY